MKDWIIAFATEKFHVTAEDATFYKEQVSKGSKFVQLKNGMMLSDRALYIIPGKTIEESKQLETGKYQCSGGNWHTKNAECYCNGEWKTLPNGKSVFVENKIEQS